MNKENVILVDDLDAAIGEMEKIEAHRKGLLHRAFSVFVFNGKGEMLLQRRALHKYHSGGLWSNACCSHPYPGEKVEDAAVRRLNEELGFQTPVTKVFEFTYRSEFDNGLTEYEYDHVFTGEYNGALLINPDEVSDFCFKDIEDIRQSMQSHPEKFTKWFHIVFGRIESWWHENYRHLAAS
jgi:isopentenyl-diphosphate Delta-isomerase